MQAQRGTRIEILLAASDALGDLCDMQKRRILLFYFCFIALFALALPLRAQPAAPSTDYEWELQTPNRLLFRDRIPVGDVPLSLPQKSGFFGKRKAKGGDALGMVVDVAFVPGDTARYVAVVFDYKTGDIVNASVLLDAAEIPSLRQSVDYMLTTSQNIANTERRDTRVSYRSRAGMEVAFSQKIKAQSFDFLFPKQGDRDAMTVVLSRDNVLLFKDLLDLLLFELKRQGASLPTISGSQQP